MPLLGIRARDTGRLRYKAKVDANQQDIVKALRDMGCSVQSLAMVGGGVPDLLVGYRGNNYLFEVKDGSKPPSARALTPDQLDWLQQWRGQWALIETVEEVKIAIASFP